MRRRNTSAAYVMVATLAGVIVGVVCCLAVQRLSPVTRVQPTLYATNSLRFGTDEVGRPALCDEEGNAWTVSDEADVSGQQLAHSIRRDGDVLTALRCK